MTLDPRTPRPMRASPRDPPLPGTPRMRSPPTTVGTPQTLPPPAHCEPTPVHAAGMTRTTLRSPLYTTRTYTDNSPKPSPKVLSPHPFQTHTLLHPAKCTRAGTETTRRSHQERPRPRSPAPNQAPATARTPQPIHRPRHHPSPLRRSPPPPYHQGSPGASTHRKQLQATRRSYIASCPSQTTGSERLNSIF